MFFVHDGLLIVLSVRPPPPTEPEVGDEPVLDYFHYSYRR